MNPKALLDGFIFLRNGETEKTFRKKIESFKNEFSWNGTESHPPQIFWPRLATGEPLAVIEPRTFDSLVVTVNHCVATINI